MTINNAGLLSFITPATDGQTFSGNIPVQAAAETSDPVINRVDLWPYGTEHLVLTSTDTTSPFNWDLDTTTLPNGSYCMRAKAIKQGGGKVVNCPERTIIVNNPNLLSITTPANDGAIVSGNTTIVIEAQITTPDYGRIEIQFSGESSPWVIDSRPFEYTFDSADYPNGVYTIIVRAYKPDGRIIPDSLATRTFIINNQYTNCQTIQDARKLTNGSGALLEGKIVSADTSSAMDDAFYIAEPNRSAGLRVAWTGSTVPSGKEVIVLGTVGNNESTGERQLVADDVYIGDDAPPIQPVGMNNYSLGGAAPLSESYTQGITGGAGLYNIGLLVRVWGKVEYVGSDYVYINDGSNLQDGNTREGPVIVPLDGGDIPAEHPSVKGLRVYCGVMDKPGIGDHVSVTGISSATTIGSNIVRCVRLKSQDDITYNTSYTRCAKKQYSPLSWDGYFVDINQNAIPVGSKVRMVNAMVEQNLTNHLKARHYDYDISSFFTNMWIPSYISATTQLGAYDPVTITGTSFTNGTDQWIIPDHIYLGGRSYGAMSMNSMAGCDGMMCSTPEVIEYGGGPFKPWPSPTLEEILASPWFQSAYYKEGAIGWALLQPDGTAVDLLGEEVIYEWNNGAILGIKEAFEPNTGSPKLLLVLDKPTSGLCDGMCSIDIIGGTLTTLSNGQRAIIKPKAVYAYTDQKGRYMFTLPWPKWLRDPANPSYLWSFWPWKVQIVP